MKKDLAKILKEARRQGFEVRRTRNNHIQVRAAGRIVAISGTTPSDSRALTNFLGDLKRAGFTWPPPRDKRR